MTLSTVILIGLKWFLSVKEPDVNTVEAIDVVHKDGNVPVVVLILNILVSGREIIGSTNFRSRCEILSIRQPF